MPVPCLPWVNAVNVSVNFDCLGVFPIHGLTLVAVDRSSTGFSVEVKIREEHNIKDREICGRELMVMFDKP